MRKFLPLHYHHRHKPYFRPYRPLRRGVPSSVRRSRSALEMTRLAVALMPTPTLGCFPSTSCLTTTLWTHLIPPPMSLVLTHRERVGRKWSISATPRLSAV